MVRNDLEPDVADGRTESVYATLRSSPGLTKVTGFGPKLGGQPMIDLDSERSFSEGGWQSSHPAIEIWRFYDPAGSTSVQSLEDTPTVVGAADSLTVLDDLDLIRGRSVVLAQDQGTASPLGQLIVTDGLRRQEAAFGRVDTLRSASLTVDDPYTLKRKVHDYIQTRDEPWMSIPELRGARSLTASGSRSTADSLGGIDPGTHPWSAFDGDDRTAWVAGADTGWLWLALSDKRDLGTVQITVDAAPGEGAPEDRHRARRCPSRRRRPAARPGRRRRGRSLRIDGDRPGNRPLAIADVRRRRCPCRGPSWCRRAASLGKVDQIVLGVDEGNRPACITVEGLDRCRADTGAQSEDRVLVDRELSLPTASSYDLAATTTPLAGPALDSFLQDGLPYSVTATSSAAADVRNSVARVVDGDGRMGWIAARETPTVARRDVGVDADALADPVDRRAWPARLEGLGGDPRARRRVLAAGDLKDGEGTFPRVRARHVAIHLTWASDAHDFGTDGFSKVLPVGISELSFGDKSVTRPDRSFTRSPCRVVPGRRLA